MNTDIIKIKSDIILTDNEGNPIEVQVFEPELLDTWV